VAIGQFQRWYESRHDYQKDWKKRTGQKMVGYSYTYSPEEIYYAFNVLPVRIFGFHEIWDETNSLIFEISFPYCRNVFAQALGGVYDYLDGIAIGQSCVHLKKAFSSWESNRPSGWIHHLPTPDITLNHNTIPYLRNEYEQLIRKLELLTGRTITNSDLEKGICLMNEVRQTMKRIYEFRKLDNPPITGVEAMYMTCSTFFTDAREWLPVAREVLKKLETRKLDRNTGQRLIFVGCENDDLEFMDMIEDLGESDAISVTIVVEEHCSTTRYFWDVKPGRDLMTR
jgi:benzoyl-CoA reductase subunit C